MKGIHKLFTFFLLFTTFGIFAQMQKGENHFSKFDYAKAIPAFEKVAKGNSPDKQQALIKLADCHRILNNYAKAESY